MPRQFPQLPLNGLLLLFIFIAAFNVVLKAKAEVPSDQDPLFGVAAANQVVELDMTENRFHLKEVTVRAGDVIRFVVNNISNTGHRFSVGENLIKTLHEQQNAEAPEGAQKDLDTRSTGSTLPTTEDPPVASEPGSHHHYFPESANEGLPLVRNAASLPSVYIPAGKTRELLVVFQAGTIASFACSLDGHYKQGMSGRVTIKEAN